MGSSRSWAKRKLGNDLCDEIASSMDVRGCAARSMISLRLPNRYDEHWRDALRRLLLELPSGSEPVLIDCNDWVLRCDDLKHLQAALQNAGHPLMHLLTDQSETTVSAQALGHNVISGSSNSGNTPSAAGTASPLLFHQGTLRSGDHLHAQGDVLLYGDVNPGARISAVGHVQVWGRLRGIAHAGCEGDRSATVIAHQLRPLQLRIADVVARGPEDQPQPGLMEQARLDQGDIVIEPAATLPAPQR